VQQCHQALTTALKKVSQGRILDVATGAGNFARNIWEVRGSSMEIIAVDTLVRSLISVTPEKIPGVLTAAMDGMQMAFGDSVFTGAAISNSLHHMENPVKVLTEMVRILEPGGILIVNEMFSDGNQSQSQLTHTMMHNWWGAVDRYRGNSHNPVYTRKELESLIETSGIEDVNYAVHEDISGDPHSPELRDHLTKSHQTLTKEIAGNSKLEEQGEAAWKHYKKHGFTAARSLMAWGNIK